MKLLGSNSKAEVTGQYELPGKSNYFIGNDPKNWHTDVRQFSKVRYANVYPAVDLVYYGHQKELEYDFVLHPGASPQAIRLWIEGARRPRLEYGGIVLTSVSGNVHLRPPHVYQEADGVRHDVRGRYVLKSNGEVGFEVAGYDRRRELVIDPVLAFSTYLGGSGVDSGTSIAVGVAHNVYVTGYTSSTDFPLVNARQTVREGADDAFVTKLNADGTALVYSTYLGGIGDNVGTGIAVDTFGNAYVCGVTTSPDFPVANAFQPNLKGFDDGFVTKISAHGNELLYSTYLGGSIANWATGIAIDSTGAAYVVGWTGSDDFPTVNAIQSTLGGVLRSSDAFITKFKPDGSALVYSTYLGGTEQDIGESIAVDSVGNAYVTGGTGSIDFPTKNALQPTNAGNGDAFVTKINAAGSALVYSTYLGGNASESGFGIAVDSMGNAYVTGHTSSTDFPTLNAIQPSCGGCQDAYVTKINATGSALVYSTYLGGSGSEEGRGIAVDASGNAYVAGNTDSTNFPVANAFQPTNQGGSDMFVTEINALGNAFIYSTYLGGKKSDVDKSIALDSRGSVYITGDNTGGTTGGPFPTTSVAFQQVARGGNATKGPSDAVVAKIAGHTSISISAAKLTFALVVIGTTSMTKTLTVTQQVCSNGIL